MGWSFIGVHWEMVRVSGEAEKWLFRTNVLLWWGTFDKVWVHYDHKHCQCFKYREVTIWVHCEMWSIDFCDTVFKSALWLHASADALTLCLWEVTLWNTWIYSTMYMHSWSISLTFCPHGGNLLQKVGNVILAWYYSLWHHQCVLQHWYHVVHGHPL